MRLGVAIVLLAGSVALAQTLPIPAPETPSLRTQSNVVLVPALVRNAKGEVVFTLKAGDFRVTDDGIEQPLTLDEDTGSEPLALVVAVESGGAGRSKLESYRHLTSVIDAVVGGVPHRVAVVEFDSTPSLLLGFTSDADAAGASLDGLEPGDNGAATLDALKYSVDLLRKQPPSYRRAILLISETVDRDSQTKLGDAVRAISDTNTAIYSIGFSTGKSRAGGEAGRIMNDPTPGPAHGCMARDETNEDESRAKQTFDCLGLLIPPLRLGKIAVLAVADGLEKNVPETVAHLTGGEYFAFGNGKNLVRSLLTISNHLPNRYVLSFQPSSPHAGFHAVELKLNDHPGLHVTARSGYWADDDEAHGP